MHDKYVYLFPENKPISRSCIQTCHTCIGIHRVTRIKQIHRGIEVQDHLFPRSFGYDASTKSKPQGGYRCIVELPVYSRGMQRHVKPLQSCLTILATQTLPIFLCCIDYFLSANKMLNCAQRHMSELP